MEIEIVAEGLQFPQGPIAIPDGSVILVEIKRQTLARVSANGGEERARPFIARSGAGRLAEVRWPRPGSKLNFPSAR